MEQPYCAFFVQRTFRCYNVAILINTRVDIGGVMVASINNNSSSSLIPKIDPRQVQNEKLIEERRLAEDRTIERQEQARQAEITAQENRADAEARTGSIIDVIA